MEGSCVLLVSGQTLTHQDILFAGSHVLCPKGLSYQWVIHVVPLNPLRSYRISLDPVINLVARMDLLVL